MVIPKTCEVKNMSPLTKAYVVFAIYLIPVTCFILIPQAFEKRHIIIPGSWVSIILAFYLFKLGNIRSFINPSRKSIIFSALTVVVSIPLLWVFSRFAVVNTSYRVLDGALIYIVYILLLSPAQELIYRSIIFRLLDIMKWHSYLYIPISTLIFASFHIHYPNSLLIIFSIVGGIIWGAIYYKTKDLVSITISHGALGAAALGFGLI